MKAVRAFIGGSGADIFSETSVVERLLGNVNRFRGPRETGSVRVAYIGTATYDLPEYQLKQTGLLEKRGCEVRPILIADPSKARITADEASFLEVADVILVSGGNTLYAIRRWEETSLAALLKEAVARQVLVAGGSAGAICWFTSGHSDSADPTTFCTPMIMKALGKEKTCTPEEEEANKKWFYIRVHGLGILPGMLCPHYDRTQSNGVVRSEDFARMMKRHPTERGIAIDHWAVLTLAGDGTYEVFPVPGKTRTPLKESDESDESPSVFTLDVNNGEVTTLKAPSKGEVEALLREPTGPLVKDPFEMFTAMSNPTPSSGKFVTR